MPEDAIEPPFVSRCDSISPESLLRCEKPAGHDDGPEPTAHSARRSEHGTAAWGNEPSTISGYTRDELRRYVLTEQILHDPSKQGHGYDRCEHCHFTRHPCSVYELATIVLEMLSASEPASAEAVPRAETSVVRPPESPRTGQGPPEA